MNVFEHTISHPSITCSNSSSVKFFLKKTKKNESKRMNEDVYPCVVDAETLTIIIVACVKNFDKFSLNFARSTLFPKA